MTASADFRMLSDGFEVVVGEVVGGWEHCRARITFGTPYRGSPSALENPANGFRKLTLDGLR